MRAVRVLVIEDAASKAAEICAEIRAFFGNRVALEVADVFAEAVRKIHGQEYDLIVTDLLLPRRRGEDEIDVSEDIIDELANSTKNALTTVVAISRFEDLVAERQNAFTQSGIFLIRFDDDWRRCLNICMQKVAFRTACDFVIICAIELEREAFEGVNHPGFEFGELVSAHGLDARNFRIGDLTGVCIVQPRMGLVDAGIVATRALDLFSPKLICMAGICGGMKDEADIGTLLISDICWEHQAGKWNADGFVLRSYQEPLNNQLRVTLQQMIIADPALASLRSRPHEVQVPLVGAKILPTASGSAVIAAKGYAQEISAQHGKIGGIDMEVYGIHRAAALHGGVKCFAAKTVVDHADEAKGDGWQKPGAILSARFVVKAIEQLFKDGGL